MDVEQELKELTELLEKASYKDMKPEERRKHNRNKERKAVLTNRLYLTRANLA